MDKEDVIITRIQWNIIPPGKRDPAICYNLEEPGGHCAKCNRKTSTVFSLAG
jgi:hypothetical protein